MDQRSSPALQGLDKAGQVISIGTFSKVLFPALRLGYLILPLHLVEASQIIHNLIDSHSTILENRPF